MSTNFSPWVDDSQTSSIMTQSTFNADSQRSNGFAQGTAASSSRVNTALREATLITTALMDVIAPDSDVDVQSALSDVEEPIADYFNPLLNSASLDTSSKVLSFPRNNGTSLSINLSPIIPTYSTFAQGSAGLVPAPTSGDTGKYLRGDGTWQTISTPTPTTTGITVNGTSGVDTLTFTPTDFVDVTTTGTSSAITLKRQLTQSVTLSSSATSGTLTESQITTLLNEDSRIVYGDLQMKMFSKNTSSLLTYFASYITSNVVYFSLLTISLASGSRGNWSITTKAYPTGLPTVTSTDNGKTLKVVDGAWSMIQGHVLPSNVLSSVITTKTTRSIALSEGMTFIEVIGRVSTDAAAQTLTLPLDALSSTATKYQLADEQSYMTFNLTYSSNTLTVQIGTTNANGYQIQKIYAWR